MSLDRMNAVTTSESETASGGFGIKYMIQVAIVGGTGYTALELIIILLRHPQVRIAAVTSRQEGAPYVAEHHPSLARRLDLRMEPFDADALVARGVKCVF